MVTFQVCAGKFLFQHYFTKKKRKKEKKKKLSVIHYTIQFKKSWVSICTAPISRSCEQRLTPCVGRSRRRWCLPCHFIFECQLDNYSTIMHRGRRKIHTLFWASAVYLESRNYKDRSNRRTPTKVLWSKWARFGVRNFHGQASRNLDPPFFFLPCNTNCSLDWALNLSVRR